MTGLPVISLMQKQVNVSIKAPYFCYGELTSQTEDVWIICHGYGQLAKYFLRRFDVLDSKSNYVIAPEGLSHFYLKDDYQNVGASWMTREYRLDEIDNQSAYLNAIVSQELPNRSSSAYQLNLLGFSQGTATIVRWAAHQKVVFDRMILWAGSFPHDVPKGSFDYLPPTSEIWVVYGSEDPFLTETRLQEQATMMKGMFAQEVRILPFEGKHEVPREVLQKLISRWNLEEKPELR